MRLEHQRANLHVAGGARFLAAADGAAGGLGDFDVLVNQAAVPEDGDAGALGLGAILEARGAEPDVVALPGARPGAGVHIGGLDAVNRAGLVVAGGFFPGSVPSTWIS